MDELGTLVLKFHVFHGPAKARNRQIVLLRRHSCLLKEAKKIVADFVENNRDNMNVLAMEASWQVSPVILELS